MINDKVIPTNVKKFDRECIPSQNKNMPPRNADPPKIAEHVDKIQLRDPSHF